MSWDVLLNELVAAALYMGVVVTDEAEVFARRVCGFSVPSTKPIMERPSQ